ncbi:MAG: hypothetical protein RL621_1496 [Bacteroidota bacterium]|jgi:hypothetical protein
MFYNMLLFDSRKQRYIFPTKLVDFCIIFFKDLYERLLMHEKLFGI